MPLDLAMQSDHNETVSSAALSLEPADTEREGLMMHALSRHVAVALLFPLLLAPLRSTGGAETAEPQDFGKLPAPLDMVSANLMDIEQSGYLAVTAATHRDLGLDSEAGVTWTLTARRPITYRHVLMLLERYRMARFYKIAASGPRHLHSVVLFYPDYVATRAIDGEILRRDGEIEVWINLSQRKADALIREEVDHVMFGEPPN